MWCIQSCKNILVACTYGRTVDLLLLPDVNECQLGADPCVNAECNNTAGSYICRPCFPGFIPGNQTTCSELCLHISILCMQNCGNKNELPINRTIATVLVQWYENFDCIVRCFLSVFCCCCCCCCCCCFLFVFFWGGGGITTKKKTEVCCSQPVASTWKSPA